MKTVFSNRQLAHVWAQQNQSEGRGSNFYFRDTTIYSYGKHFPIASFMRGKLLFNSEGYSPSTGKHINYTLQSLSYEQRQTMIRVPTHILKDALRIDSYTNGSWPLDPKTMRGHYKNFVAFVAKWIDSEIVIAAQTAAKRRKKSLIENDISVAVNAASNARELLALFKLKLPAKTEKALSELQENLQTVLERHAKQIAAENRKREKARKEAEKQRKEREARIAALIPAAVAKWRNCERLEGEEREAMAQTGIIYLRVNGEKIETSQGADFPVEHAKKAFTMIRFIKEKGGAYARGEEENKVIRLGHFQVDTITPQGNVKAGCHFVEWPQIEAVARELKIFP